VTVVQRWGGFGWRGREEKTKRVGTARRTEWGIGSIMGNSGEHDFVGRDL